MVVTAMTNNEAYWTERALKRAEEAYLHDAALTAKLFQEYESAAKAIKHEISAFYSKYAGKYGLTYADLPVCIPGKRRLFPVV